MPNICGFVLRVFGSTEEQQPVADWVNSQCDEHGYINDPREALINSWVQLYGKGELNPDEPEVLLIQGEAKNNPGLFLARMIAERFPTVRVEIGGSDEEGTAEVWELQGGSTRLLTFSNTIRFDRFCVDDYEVRDGLRLSHEERIEMAYQQVVEAGLANDKYPDEWKDAIREDLQDVLPVYFDDEFIQSLPCREQGERDEQTSQTC